MGGRLFDGLPNLKQVNLLSNECISQRFTESLQLKDVRKIVSQKCSPEDQCGVVQVTGGFVVGGKEVKRGHWPFLVALLLLKNDAFFCGGNLISSKHVLSGKLNFLTLWDPPRLVQGASEKLQMPRENSVAL